MMYKLLINSLLFSLIVFLVGCSNSTLLKSDSFEMEVDDKGFVTAFINSETKANYLVNNPNSPLLAIRISGLYEEPTTLTFDEPSGILTLDYAVSNSKVEIKTIQKDDYITFEVVNIISDSYIELAVWGPYSTSISQTIGECVGVVRDDSYAIGIQALNPKTLGGYPTEESDIDQSFDIFATNSLVDVPDSAKVLYRGQTARHTAYGSVIQAYTRDRSKDRIIPMWGHEKYLAPAFDDGGILGSKIALFGTSTDKVLDKLEAIDCLKKEM